MIDVPEGFLGAVIEKLGPRRAEMLEMKNPGQGMVRLRYRIPARGLFGYRSEFLTDTRGTGVIHHRFLDYGPWAGPLAGRTRGTLVSMEAGTIVAFALANLQERSTLFVSPGDAVYEGMIVGENSRPGDMDVNPTKEKKLTNMRSKASDENVQLEPPRELTLEGALEYIEDDELIEVTPQSIRLRKRFLSANDRKKLSREAKRERSLSSALWKLTCGESPSVSVCSTARSLSISAWMPKARKPHHANSPAFRLTTPATVSISLTGVRVLRQAITCGLGSGLTP
jgi:GTP-binding protein